MRNYDYSPSAFDCLILHTNWQGRRVMGTSDGMWGLVDGINDAGLAVSLTFGGRRVVGDGFGVPLILRYVLQTCDTAEQAGEVLRRGAHAYELQCDGGRCRTEISHRADGPGPQDIAHQCRCRHQSPGTCRMGQPRPLHRHGWNASGFCYSG